MTSKNAQEGLPLPAIRVETAETGHGLDLDAIEARERAATPGPWAWKASTIWGEVEAWKNGYVQLNREGLEGGDPEVLGAWFQYADDGGLTIERPDADFIAACREDVPRMAKEIRRLRAALVGALEWLECDEVELAAEVMAEALEGK